MNSEELKKYIIEMISDIDDTMALNRIYQTAHRFFIRRMNGRSGDKEIREKKCMIIMRLLETQDFEKLKLIDRFANGLLS